MIYRPDVGRGDVTGWCSIAAAQDAGSRHPAAGRCSTRQAAASLRRMFGQHWLDLLRIPMRPQPGPAVRVRVHHWRPVVRLSVPPCTKFMSQGHGQTRVIMRLVSTTTYRPSQACHPSAWPCRCPTGEWFCGMAQHPAHRSAFRSCASSQCPTCSGRYQMRR